MKNNVPNLNKENIQIDNQFTGANSSNRKYSMIIDEDSETSKFKVEDEIDSSFKTNITLSECPSSFIELMDENLREFIFKPAPKLSTVKCLINRYRPSLDVSPTFYMYYEGENKKKVK